MTAHVVLRSVDPSGAPATMSRPILTGLLREELGYDGLIVTDALDMGGATGTYPPDVAPVEALKAGADQLVLAPQMDVAYNAVLDAVRSGEISEAAARRVGLPDPAAEDEARPVRRPVRRRRPGRDGRRRARPPRRRAGHHRPHHDAGHATTPALLPLTADPRDVLVTGWGVTTTRRSATRSPRRQ